MTEPALEQVEGFWYPAADRECRKTVNSWTGPFSRVLPLVTERTACVQAGGNVGLWPAKLASVFKTVYTFEPDALNFHCLARNATASNIVKFQCALGEGRELPVGMLRDPENCGGYQIQGTGTIPVIALDSLNLSGIGLMYLDIEGYEPRALLGARKTIARCRPVIAIENKGLSEMYGIPKDALEDMLTKGFGYRQADEFARDQVYLPC